MKTDDAFRLYNLANDVAHAELLLERGELTALRENIEQYMDAVELFEAEAVSGVCPSQSTIEIPLIQIGKSILQIFGYPEPRTREELRPIRHLTFEKLVPRKQIIPTALRWEVFLRDNFTCKTCGARRELSVDHIIAESKGGELVMENLQTLCRSCNSRKGNR